MRYYNRFTLLGEIKHISDYAMHHKNSRTVWLQVNDNTLEVIIPEKILGDTELAQGMKILVGGSMCDTDCYISLIAGELTFLGSKKVRDKLTQNKPEHGKVYALTGGPGEKCISNGYTWSESEVQS